MVLLLPLPPSSLLLKLPLLPSPPHPLPSPVCTYSHTFLLSYNLFSFLFTASLRLARFDAQRCPAVLAVLRRAAHWAAQPSREWPLPLCNERARQRALPGEHL